MFKDKKCTLTNLYNLAQKGQSIHIDNLGIRIQQRNGDYLINEINPKLLTNNKQLEERKPKITDLKVTLVDSSLVWNPRDNLRYILNLRLTEVLSDVWESQQLTLLPLYITDTQSIRLLAHTKGEENTNELSLFFMPLYLFLDYYGYRGQTLYGEQLDKIPKIYLEQVLKYNDSYKSFVNSMTIFGITNDNKLTYGDTTTDLAGNLLEINSPININADSIQVYDCENIKYISTFCSHNTENTPSWEQIQKGETRVFTNIHNIKNITDLLHATGLLADIMDDYIYDLRTFNEEALIKQLLRLEESKLKELICIITRYQLNNPKLGSMLIELTLRKQIKELLITSEDTSKVGTLEEALFYSTDWNSLYISGGEIGIGHGFPDTYVAKILGPTPKLLCETTESIGKAVPDTKDGKLFRLHSKDKEEYKRRLNGMRNSIAETLARI